MLQVPVRTPCAISRGRLNSYGGVHFKEWCPEGRNPSLCCLTVGSADRSVTVLQHFQRSCNSACELVTSTSPLLLLTFFSLEMPWLLVDVLSAVNEYEAQWFMWYSIWHINLEYMYLNFTWERRGQMPRKGTMPKSYLSYNGPFGSVIITITKTPWCWQVWCAEAFWWMDKRMKNTPSARKVV